MLGVVALTLTIKKMNGYIGNAYSHNRNIVKSWDINTCGVYMPISVTHGDVELCEAVFRPPHHHVQLIKVASSICHYILSFILNKYNCV